MRTQLFKIFMFLGMFILQQGLILPYLMVNEIVPLWQAILLLSFSLIIWVVFVDRIALMLERKLRDDDEIIRKD